MRLHRLCNNDHYFETQSQLMAHHFILRGYLQTIIRAVLSQAKFVDRAFSSYSPRPFLSHVSPHLELLQCTILRPFQLLQSKPFTSYIFLTHLFHPSNEPITYVTSLFKVSLSLAPTPAPTHTVAPTLISPTPPSSQELIIFPVNCSSSNAFHCSSCCFCPSLTPLG